MFVRYLALLALCLTGYSQVERTAPEMRRDPLQEFVRVSPRDSRYLERTDGTPYIPIGLNMISPSGATRGDEAAGLAEFESWIQQLSANGGNYIRVWLSSPFWDVEHEESGIYDEEKAQRIDRMLEMCRERGIRAKLTLEHFRTIGDDVPNKKSWNDKPLHHADNGGTATSIADFFDGEASRALFRKKIRWFADRYGDDPIIYGWELWNEVNAVRGGDYMAWTEVMLGELHRAWPQNLCLQSLGSFDREEKREVYREHSTMAGNDLAQVHRYLDLGAKMEICHGPVDVLAADAVRELLSYQPDRPVILAEAGAVEPGHAGPFRYYETDQAGIILHDVLFAPFFAGSAGTGQIWHWDQYVAKNDLWHHFGRFAAVVEGVDPPAEGFKPGFEEQGRLRVYTLDGNKTTLIWCRDSKNDWRSELERGEAPETISGFELNLGEAAGDAGVYDPWLGKWSEGKAVDGRLRLPDFSRSIVVRIRE